MHSMATIVRTEERNGDIIAIYESGAEYNQTTKRLVKAPPSAAITVENANIYKRRRQEKAAARLRQRILETTQKRSDITLSGSAEAVAEAGAYIWDEVVLGEDVYPRDRLEAWEKLGKYAGILPSDMRKEEPAQAAAQAATVGAAVAAAIRAVLDDIAGANAFDNNSYRKHDIIDVSPAPPARQPDDSTDTEKQ